MTRARFTVRRYANVYEDMEYIPLKAYWADADSFLLEIAGANEMPNFYWREDFEVIGD